jgi:CheY-specific phosphatase CheX
MPTELIVGVPPAELAQVVDAVFGTMLKMEVCESSASWFAAEDRLTGTVHLAGDWNGAVLLECNQWQACRFAGRFLSIDPPDAVDDVVRDVLGELVNMIGGNLKCVLTRGIRLSMPSVVDGSQHSLRVCGVEREDHLAFQCADGLFWITVMTTRTVRGVSLP